MTNKPQRYVLLDRDGVINRRIFGSYVACWREFEFLPRALEALRLLAENGYAGLVISNQSCVGEKLLTVADLESITHRFLLEVALAGGNIIQVYYCLDVAKDLCNCREPQPGLLERAQLDYSFVPHETYFVGEVPYDVAAAESAGCPAILVRRDAFLEKPAAENAEKVASNLYEAAEIIIARQRSGHSWLQTPSKVEGRTRLFHVGQN